MVPLRKALPIWATALFFTLPAWAGASAGTSITTYHYDNLRTGWNPTETTLNPAVVASSSFGLQHQVALDEQVDAQPLFLPKQHIAGVSGLHDVVYVATEGNTIYAIDADSGAVLNSQNYGEPVPKEFLPGDCSNNSNNVGINSTPVIDASTGTIYAITYVLELEFIPPSTLEKVPTFLLHALDASTLRDKIAPVVISATGTLSNGKSFAFVAANTRQRPALIETGGNIYAGFGSFCDLNVNVSRGWVLGWNATTLAPLTGAELTNQNARSGDNYFLTAAWMSGYGISSDDKGNLFYATGNSDKNGKSYNESYNLDESVVELNANLATESYFTPNGGPNGWSALDQDDGDFGSSGVLLLPDQPGPYPHLAVAAGKQGPMYLLNRDNLGGLGTTKVTLGGYKNYGCWCGPSYYVGGDGVGRVVEPTGNSLDVWTLQTSPSPVLVHESSNGVVGGQLPGFFATVSSNGTKPNSAVIWAVTRPTDTNPAEVILDAFDPANNSVQLFSGVAGTWPFSFATSNLVPVVADGHVFVGSYQNLSIFGLTGAGVAKVNFVAPPRPVMRADKSAAHQVCGVVLAVAGETMTLRTRDGATLHVDVGTAEKAGLYATSAPGHAALVRGDYKEGVFVAKTVLHAMPNQVMWPADY
jgi:hypothetical protein